ncbi:MAG: hypothetical protein KAS72_09050 [Phycisphaerales bacterium]|nr:hypothetical protein [Phycisphaerales bacterium]
MPSSCSVRTLAVGSLLIAAGSAAYGEDIPFPPQEVGVDLASFATQIASLDVNADTSYVWPDTYAGELDVGGTPIPYTTEFVSTVWRVTTPIALTDITLSVGDMVYAYEITMPFEAPGTIELGITEVQINGVMSEHLLEADMIMGMGYTLPELGVDVPVDLKIDDFSEYGYGSQAEWAWDDYAQPRGELDNDETIQLLLFTGPSIPVREDIGALIGPFVPGGPDPEDIPVLIPVIPGPTAFACFATGVLVTSSRRRRN